MMCGQAQCAFSAMFSFGLKTKAFSALISHFLLIIGGIFKAVHWPVSSHYEKFSPMLAFALELGLFMSLWGIAAKPLKAQVAFGENIVPWKIEWGFQDLSLQISKAVFGYCGMSHSTPGFST